MHLCGEFVNIVVKLKHHLRHMIIFYAIYDISAAHTDDLLVSWLFFCFQFLFLLAYFIEGLACTAVLRIIGFNGDIIGDTCLVISGWISSPGGRNTNCILGGYLIATNAVYRCVLDCAMHLCGEFVDIVVKLKHHLWNMTLSFAIYDMSAAHTNDLLVSRVFHCLQFRFLVAYFIVGLVCMAVLRTIGFNGAIISNILLIISDWIIIPAGRNSNCIFWGYLFATNAVFIDVYFIVVCTGAANL